MKLPHSNGHWRGFGGPPELFDRLRIGHVRRDRRTEEYIVIDAVVAEKIALLLAEMDGEIDAISGDDGAHEPSGGNPAFLTFSIDPDAHWQTFNESRLICRL
jgi:hypothetical protein